MLTTMRMAIVLFFVGGQMLLLAQTKEQAEELRLTAKTSLQEMERTIQAVNHDW